MAFWNRIKSTYDVARETGIEEEKIKELKEGKREITGETMDKVLKAINKTETEKSIEKANIYQWYMETDLTQEREKFGYKNQKELALASNIHNSNISKLENKKFDKVNNDMIRLYDFYHNDFNIQIANEGIDEQKKEVWKWYNEIKDLKLYRRDFGYSLNKFMLMLNISYDQLRDFENHRYKKWNKTMQLFYDFYHNEDNRLPKRNNLQYVMPMDNPVFKWYMETDFESIKKEYGLTNKQFAQKIGISQTSMCEIIAHKQRVLSKSVQAIYDFFQDEEKRNKIDNIEEEKEEDKGEIEVRIPENYMIDVVVDEEVKDDVQESIYDNFTCESKAQPVLGIRTEDYIKELQDEIERLKKQVARYEKLIDRM